MEHIPTTPLLQPLKTLHPPPVTPGPRKSGLIHCFPFCHGLISLSTTCLKLSSNSWSSCLSRPFSQVCTIMPGSVHSFLNIWWWVSITREDIEIDEKTPMCKESCSSTACSRLELMHSLSQTHLLQDTRKNSYILDTVQNFLLSHQILIRTRGWDQHDSHFKEKKTKRPEVRK